MILLVDDDHAIAQIMHGLLTKEGYAVRLAANGNEAYSILKQSPCRGIVLDMMMPGLNGAGLLMLMAAEKMTVPVIVMTAAPDFSEEEVREFPNVVDFIKKPFYPEEAVSIIRKHFPAPGV